MTLKLNGTNSEAAPAYAGDDADTGLQCGTNELKLVTGGSARATVDSSGNVLVGKTSSSGLNAGCELRPAGMGLFTRASANPVQVRRLTDDGDLVELYKDSTLRGSVGVSGTSLTVGVAGTERLRILSGGGLAFNGDTAQANALSDYEEGSWTATLVTGTCTSNSGKYIKIGNFVRVSATLYGFSNRTSSNIVQINNAPFASSGAQVAQAAGSMFGKYLDRTGFTSYISNTGMIEFYSISSGNWAALEHQHLNNASTSMYFQASWYID